MPKRLLALSLAVVLVLATAALVRADGDPASDTLLIADEYLPYPLPTADVAHRLTGNVNIAYAHGYRLKVAVIATVSDLGAVPSLFGKPTEYASFLGQEIKFFYGGPLLVVMPAGFGIYDVGRQTKAEDTVLARLTVKAGSIDDLTASAADAVQALVAARALTSPDITPPYSTMVPTTVRRGRPGILRFAIADDSKKATAVIRITAAGRPIGALSFRFQAAVLGGSRTATWLVPRSLKPGVVQACLFAADLSGNRSPKTCAPIKVV